MNRRLVVVVSTLEVFVEKRLLLGRGLTTSSSTLGVSVGSASIGSDAVFEASASASELLVVNRRLVLVVSTVDVLEANRLLLGRGLATSSSSLGGTVVGAASVASGTVFEASESVSELLVVNRRLVVVVSTVDVLEANRLLLGRGLATSSSSLGGTVVGAASVASGTVFEASESVSELLVVNRRLVVVVSTVDVLEASRLLLGRELTTSSSSLGTTVAGAASVDSAVVFEASESTSEVLEVNLRLTELLKRDAFAVSDDVLGSSVGFLEVNLLKREVTVDGVLSVRELKRLVYRDVTGASSSFLVTPSVVRELISRLLTRHDSGSSDVDDDDVLDVVTRELKRELVRVGSASGIACDSSTTALDQVEVDLRIGSISIDVFRVGTGVGSSFNKKNNFFQMNKTSS